VRRAVSGTSSECIAAPDVDLWRTASARFNERPLSRAVPSRHPVVFHRQSHGIRLLTVASRLAK
jgi:hypothetical protein